MIYDFSDALKKWSGEGSWYYVLLPRIAWEELRQLGPPLKAGFGSIKVTATIGSSTWQTSVFPDTTTQHYILFVKKDIRRHEALEVGVLARVHVRVRDI